MRTFNYDILELIQKRWSPRSFSSEKVKSEDLNAILEAARFAPSCFNAQPWQYIVASEDKDLKVLQNLLMDRNQLWANKAPVLMLVITKNIFDHNGKVNHYAQFDAGTSWGLLSLEAVSRGYHTHAMAGFHKELARETLGIPESYDLIAMVALGRLDVIENLHESFRAGEKPNTRKPLEDISVTVNFFKEQ